LGNMRKVSAERFRFLTQRITIATKMQDWHAIARYDSELSELLSAGRDSLTDPRIAPHVADVKAAHKVAYNALKEASSKLEAQMSKVNEQQEGTLAYQLAMSMED